MSARRDTFSRDVVWNVASLGIAGVCGVVMNYVIGVAYDASALGIFNQVFAIYIVVSQIAVLGVHSSVLYHVAARGELGERRTIATSGLIVTFAMALANAALFIALARPFARLLDSPGVETGMWWAAPGLACFALDKVVLATQNAVQRMRAYAIFYAGRFVLMLAALIGCVILDVRADRLPVILSIGEAITLVGATWTIRDHLRMPPAGELRAWARTHVAFGARGFLAGLSGELFTRIDVVILGAFASDALVGAYSFAALIAEGFYQILVALRTNYAPVMVRLLAAGERDELVRVAVRARNRTYLGALAVAAVSAAGYAIIVPLITRDPELQRSGIYYGIVIGGMAAQAGYTPFNQLLLWAGRPGWHTVMNVLMVAISAAVCTAMIAAWGAVGAAIGVAVTYALSVPLLQLMVGRVVGLRI
jgi:O-antigen/teichoic acid export membrane protein